MQNSHNRNPKIQKKSLFQSGIFTMVSKGRNDQQIQQAETQKEKKEIFDLDFTKHRLELRKGDIPHDVYKKSKDILHGGGGLTEKMLVKRMLEGIITPQRFRLLLKFLYHPDGGKEEREMKKELAEKEIAGKIPPEIFELAVSAVNRGEKEDLELVRELLREKVGPARFKKKLKDVRKLREKTIEIQERERELTEEEEEEPEQAQARYRGKYEFVAKAGKALELVATPGKVGETIEFRNYSKELIKAYKAFTEDYDELKPIFEKMGDVDKLYDAVFNLFPEVIRKGEKDITKFQIEQALKKAGVPQAAVKQNIDQIFKKVQACQRLRHKILEHEVRIAEILRSIENRISRQAIEEKVIENAGDWIGFPIKEGQKIVYNTKTIDYETGKITMGREEGEIVSVKLSRPSIFDEQGMEIDIRGIGTVMITLSGVGEFTENQFRKWVDATDACPVVKNIEDVRKITEFYDPLEKGTELAYEKIAGRDENGEVVTEQETVKVKNITDEGVELDKEVTTLHKEEAPRLVMRDELDKDRRSKKLTFGQFAKWIRRREVVWNPQNPDELQEATQRLEDARNKKYKRNPAHFRPPQWTSGERLFEDTPSASVIPRSHTAKVEVDGKKREVVMGGKHLSLAQALRTARKKELQSLDPAVEAERQTQFIDEGEAREAEKEKIQDEIRESFKEEEKTDEEESVVIPTAGEVEDWAEKANVPGGTPKGEIQPAKATLPTYSYFRNLWKSTNFLSLQDLWEFGKAAYEYHVRRWQRNVKNNYANIGRHFPYIGTEMNRIKQAAENEEVNQFKEAMENWGAWQIEDTLYATRNRDQAKACMMVLSSKGYMRWEDIRLWRTLNKFVDAGHYIPIPAHDDFTAQDKYGKTGLDYLPGAIDFLWGEGQYSEWLNQNNNTFEQNKKSFHHKGDQLEGDPKNIGGVTAELGKLLRMHKEGYYVDPQEYEGLIDFCIHKGKSSAEAKVYYLIEGCAAKNARGQTIMPWDRIGNIDGEYLNRLPMLDYFTDKFTKKAFQEKARPWKREDFEKLIAFWDGGVGVVPESVKKDGTPPHEARNFLWDEILRNPMVLQRNNKGLRNAEQIDHDDAHVIIPLASETLAENVCGGPSGMKKYFTEEGITNAYCGYNRYIKGLAEHNDVAKLLKAIKSFARYDAILDDRYLRDEGTRYTRISKSNYFRPAVIDMLYVVDHQRQLHKVLKNVARAYGWDISLMFEKTSATNTRDDTPEARRQKEVEHFIKNFGHELEKRVMSDGGKKMVQAVKDSRLTGMFYDISSEERKRRREMFANEARIHGLFLGKVGVG